jgi:alpha-amylase/alpha-mannosidase (GH57 family)
MTRARLAFLWHMHQPVYRDPETNEYILPWVRLHATRSYYDMPQVLSEFPKARATINLVPSLLSQLEDYLEGRAKDLFLSLALKPADSLEPPERAFVLKNFFMADWERCIKPLPRLWELLQKRGLDIKTVDLASVTPLFTPSELRDIQVLFNLAWFGFRSFEEEPTLRELRTKGRDFTENDKKVLFEVQLKILRQVMPALAQVAKSGQAELTVTPFYHPILPLLCDSDAARRAMPQASLPPRFQFPEDAREQVKRALDFAQSRLGVRPKGMWPAEGSVSPEAMEVFAAEGVEYVCSDEEVLLRSLPQGTPRGAALGRTYAVDAGAGRSVKMLFRDRGLSDLLGFTYSRSAPNLAVADFLGHLGRIADAAPQGEIPVVGVILDGENPWEHYPDSGRDFLRTLYGALDAREGDIEPVTLAEAFAKSPPKQRIERIHSGSWIEANYRIWISHPEDNLGWDLLGKARRLLADKQAKGFDADKCRQARDALLVAEGSDWFWWYGDDFTTESAAEFDALFRGYVARAFMLLDEPAPERLNQPIARRARQAADGSAATVREPEALIKPPIDGRATSYYAWAGSSVYHPEGDRGAMHQGSVTFGLLAFGFDLENLYLRLDPKGSPGALSQAASAVVVELTTGGKTQQIKVPLDRGETPAMALEGKSGGLGRAAVRDIVTVAVPFAELGFRVGDRVALALRVLHGEVEVERLPRTGALRFAVPGPDFERVHWHV